MKTNPFRYFVTLFFLRFATKTSKLVVPCYFVTLLLCYLVALPSLAQGTVDDYNRAYSLQTKFSAQNVYHWAQNVRWVDSTHVFHYSVQTPEGQRFILFDADKNSKQEFASDKELNDALAAIRPPQQDRPRRFGPPPTGESEGGFSLPPAAAPLDGGRRGTRPAPRHVARWQVGGMGRGLQPHRP